MVELREISASTVREIVSLRVSEKQEQYVASNALSIAEAYFEEGAWFRAIYVSEMGVGFVMLFDHTLPNASIKNGVEKNEIGLWRFMIDQRFQGQGFGRKAMDSICDHARERPGVDRLLSSYVSGPDGPEDFYLRYGFVKTGRMRNQDGEIEIVLSLR